ncbi:unnamed protein product [Rotaria sp. Silwood2]|nr:unnamed protein product [Rotaria sp. Silwood2]
MFCREFQEAFCDKNRNTNSFYLFCIIHYFKTFYLILCDSSLGLEIAPKVRFIKKGQKQEQSADISTKSSIENNNNIEHSEEENKDDDDDDDDDNDDNWFTVKKVSDILEQETVNLPEPTEKEKKLTKAKLAKKLRKKSLLINKRFEYDDEGNPIINSDEEDQSSIYNIEQAKTRLQQIDKADKEVYRALVKQKHQERRMKEKEGRRAAREAKRLKQKGEEEEEEEQEQKEEEEINGNDEESPSNGTNEQERLERKRSLSPVEPKKKKKKHRSLTEFINEDTTKTINDTEQLALYLLSK